MFCMKCGMQLPDDANYCLKCGSPQKADLASPVLAEPPQYEICEITYRHGRHFGWLTTDDFRFWAKAIGPNGPYSAGEIPARLDGLLPNPFNKKHAAALNALITKLAADGWEATGRGEGWFGYKFRRRLK